MVKRTASSPPPVPSITLQITKKDAERFLEASDALQAELDILLCGSSQEENSIIGDHHKNINEAKTKPLHEMLFQAAGQCQHPMIVQFLKRISSAADVCQKSSDASLSIKAAVLIFHNCDKTTKLRQLFSILSTVPSSENSETASIGGEEKKDDYPKMPMVELNEENAKSLFRTVLLAISCCIHAPGHFCNEIEKKNDETSRIVERIQAVVSDDIVEIEPKKNEYQPSKKIKVEHRDDIDAASRIANPVDEFGDTCQSPSWDSSLATLRDEDEKKSSSGSAGTNSMSNLVREIREIALFAAAELFRFANDRCTQLIKIGETNVSEMHKKLDSVDFATFGEWYNSSGSKIVPWLELLQRSKWKAPTQKKEQALASKIKTTKKVPKSSERCLHSSSKAVSTPVQSTSPWYSNVSTTSRTLVSFDFNGSGSPTPLLINISEDNLNALHALVHRTSLMTCTASEICRALLQAGIHRFVDGAECIILRRDDFKDALFKVIPSFAYGALSKLERECFDESFTDFFSCFEAAKDWLQPGEVDLKEFSVGFSFFCSGSKSSKLLTGFDLLDSNRRGFLTEDQLSRYLLSYLTMLVALSLLIPSSKRQHRRPLTPQRLKELRAAVESGTKWTLGHFLKASGQANNEYTFECFANWYSSGGYNVAPWLELLDLKKVMALIVEPNNHLQLPPLASLGSESYQTTKNRALSRDRVSSLRRHHLSRRGPPPEVLFTFPLGSRRSLVVLKEDARYVKSVVDQLGLLTMKPDTLWSALFKSVQARRNATVGDTAVYVDMVSFVHCMKEVCPKPIRKRAAPGVFRSSGSVEEILANFYQCFDIDQSDSVALDELMGGLTLLCGGKKSTKLAFAFSIFDTRTGITTSGKNRAIHSLSGEDLFLFLRSILIVTFSTCRQSLDMSDETVGRYIADTANMICNDVMRHQWETKQRDRLDFDEFGQWYNDGGFERAPWLELLDLNKWVLLDGCNGLDQTMEDLIGGSHDETNLDGPRHFSPPTPTPCSSTPPPPPEEALDNSFLDEIDSMDEMDMILMQTSSCDRDEHKISKSFSYSNSPRPQAPSSKAGNQLKFPLITTDEHGGYMLSLSPARINHFRGLLERSGLHNLDTETACNRILSKGYSTKLSKRAFDAAMRDLLLASHPGSSMDNQTQGTMKGIFNSIFDAFDFEGKGQVSAMEVACGFTVLCKGKKSDKLEFAFEVLDKKKCGRLSQTDMSNYLQSFLSVLLSIAFSKSLEYDSTDDTMCTMSGSQCERSTPMLILAVRAGADWAASLAFRDFESSSHDLCRSMSFDDFASWYTRSGYSSIPWLELLDLQKWAMVPEPTN